MSESPRAVHSPGGDPSYRRPADETAGIRRESQRLIEQAYAAQGQGPTTQARTAHLRDRQLVKGDAPAEAADGPLQQEWEAHGSSKLALERALARSRRLEDEVLSIQDRERDRLARDLHDGVCQSLAGISFLMEAHLRQLQELGPDSGPVRSGQQLREMLAHAFQEMRGISHGLSSFETGARGENLCPALHALAERINASGSVRCVAVCPDLPVLGSANAMHLYRIVQEAVSNAVRHGRAAHIEIGLARAAGRWQLTVTDDGTGVPDNRTPDGGGLGMRSMQYRAAVIGGTLKVRRANASADRPGTVVSCTFL